MTDKVAFVTGGNAGLGLAMALAIRLAGADVAVGDSDPNKSPESTDAFGADAIFHLDVHDEGAVAGTLEEIVGRWGRLDVLVNNATSRARRSGRCRWTSGDR